LNKLVELTTIYYIGLLLTQKVITHGDMVVLMGQAGEVRGWFNWVFDWLLKD